MKLARLTSFALTASVLSLAARGATLESLIVTREHGRYELYAETLLAAPAPEIYSVLLEYDDNAFQRISGVYKESSYLEPDDDGTPIVFTRMEGCLLFFCKSMRRVERLEAVAYRSIRTTTLPEDSDFRFSFSEWTFEPAAGGTRMTYRLVMVPDFWVPPVVGPWLLKRTLEVGGVRAIERIEAMAQGEDLPRRVAATRR